MPSAASSRPALANRRFLTRCVIAALALIGTISSPARATIVEYTTNLGSFRVRLFDSAMPRSVDNFLQYVADNDWDNTLIHRNVPGFVVQGGAYTLQEESEEVIARLPPDDQLFIVADSVPIDLPIADEPGGGVTGISNTRGTIAYAKSGPDTATSQWFFNVGDNSTLDSPLRADGGFAAFGHVLGDGMDVIDAINALPTPAGEFPALDQAKVVGQDFEYFADDVVVISDIRVLPISPGDYNVNGFIDLPDLALLQSTFGSTTLLEADGNGNGIVDAADYTVWRDLRVVPSLAITATPEPTTAGLLVIAGLGMAGCRRHRA